MADLRSQLQAGLGGSYTLERELGRGGMATVFLARDLKHDRLVALKVLHPELAASLGPDRFQREIKVAARLQHPHILTVHDSGETEGRLWFTMPFVEGESLRDRLRRERQLPVDDAIRIAREAAQALHYAHTHGVVHRDIKPENLLLTDDGNTLVADFGIARALADGPAGASGERLTETGLALGTPAYMSPEQAAGDRSLDARTDVYSLAAVLYEMLAGEPPFAAPTMQAMIMKRLTEPPPSARTARANLPEAADQAIRKALAPVAADRFGTIAEFGRALAGSGAVTSAPTAAATPASIMTSAGTGGPTVTQPTRRRNMPVAATAMLVGLLIGLGVLFAWRRSAGRAAPAADGTARIVVLPFENLGDSSDAYFASGVSDAVRGKLTELSQLQVIARGSSVQYAGSTRTPAQIASDLGVQYLLTGTVRWAKNADGTSRVQVSPELVQVGGDGAAASKWQQSFEAPINDVFKVQADIAGQVAQAMRVALPAPAQERLTKPPTENAAAYDAYLRARAADNYGADNSPAGLRRAIAQYEKAVALDPTFALAWGDMSTSQTLLYSNSFPDSALGRRGRESAERAIALDPQSGNGHRALGRYYLIVEGDAARASIELDKAATLAPGDAAVLATLSNVERSLERNDQALEHARAAYALDPRSAARAVSVVTALLFLRRPAEARPLGEQALALAPTSLLAVQLTAMVWLALGDLDGARRVLAGASAIDRSDLVAYMANYNDLGWVLDDAGQRLALSLGPDAFDGDKGTVAIVRAQLYDWRGDAHSTRAWGDSAAREFARQLHDAPNDAQRHVFHGLGLAYAGRAAEAVAEGERAVALAPMSKDAENWAYILLQLIRVYIHAGQPEKALDGLETLMSHPYGITPAWLRIDPTFDPLRKNSRFEKLATGS